MDGEKSALLPVPISELAPAIFSNGIRNPDGSINSESNAVPSIAHHEVIAIDFA